MSYLAGRRLLLAVTHACVRGCVWEGETCKEHHSWRPRVSFLEYAARKQHPLVAHALHACIPQPAIYVGCMRVYVCIARAGQGGTPLEASRPGTFSRHSAEEAADMTTPKPAGHAYTLMRRDFGGLHLS